MVRNTGFTSVKLKKGDDEMTVKEAIETVDSLKPNHYKTEQKAKWLSDLDRKIREELINTHEKSDGTVSEEYEDNEILLIDDIYSAAYIYYLSAQIDLYNFETVKYNNNMALFNAEYSAFEKWYNRTHTPKNSGRFNIV